MKMNVRNLLSVAVLAAIIPAARADEKADDKDIREVVAAYEKGLNASDAAGITKLYTADAVVMAPNNSPAVGQEIIGKVYGGLFQAVKLDIKFEVDEVKTLSDKWAMARTHSKFTVKVGDAVPQPDANQELFLFQKGDDGKWRIARYSYSSTTPAKK
jgi:uncharacterized protein (TIGR02246 family)